MAKVTPFACAAALAQARAWGEMAIQAMEGDMEKMCPVCGKKFVGMMSRIYCCDACKEQAKKIRAAGIHTEDAKTCPVCGKMFFPLYAYQRHCSIKCNDEETYGAQEKKKEVKKTEQKKKCRVCGKDISSGIFCSVKCQREEINAEKRKARPKNLRVCRDCGKPTSDYRCPTCLAKWRKKHGVSSSEDNFAHAVYGPAAC